MIKFVIIRKDEMIYNQFIGNSLKKMGTTQTCDIYPDISEDNQIPKLWNKGIDAFLNNNNLSDEDILCFIHEDVSIVDPYFLQKLEMAFKLKPEIGLFSVAGSNNIPENGMWFMDAERVKGQWVQSHQNETILLSKGNVGFFDDVVVCHKFFMAIRPSLIKEGLRFDECFHKDLYNVDFSLQVLERGYKIGIIDILLHHNSIREANEDLGYFQNKYKEKNYTFPITLDQFKNLNDIQGVEISL